MAQPSDARVEAMSEQLCKRLRQAKRLSDRLRIEHDPTAKLMAEAADEIEAARRTAEYWKAEHLAANAEIERLQAGIKQWASECAECAGAGIIIGTLPSADCPACKDIYALLKEST